MKTANSQLSENSPKTCPQHKSGYRQNRQSRLTDIIWNRLTRLYKQNHNNTIQRCSTIKEHKLVAKQIAQKMWEKTRSCTFRSSYLATENDKISVRPSEGGSPEGGGGVLPRSEVGYSPLPYLVYRKQKQFPTPVKYTQNVTFLEELPTVKRHFIDVPMQVSFKQIY